jgi:type 1 glutamine amidotransferase
MKVRVAIGGHRFDAQAFDALLASLPDTACEIIKQPNAAALMNPRDMQNVDALLLYDLPGLDFRDPADPPRQLEPTAEFTAGFEALLEAGVGIVALHHALAGWPAWPRYAEALGGTFLYRGGVVRGRDCADSGYAPDASYRANVVRPDHPIAAGLPVSFELRDELYLCEVFASEIEPILRADFRFESPNFQSAAAAVCGHTALARPREPAPESSTIAWTRMIGRSRLVYIQPGDSGATLRNPHYQRLVANALRWVVS